MPHDRGPEQTETWPRLWADLDPEHLPAWVVWDRLCALRGADGEPCPRRLAGIHFGSQRCDHHWPTDVRVPVGQIIG
jgi:hypothetical protein